MPYSPTQPGHPCVDGHNDYRQWLLPSPWKKWQVLHNTRPVINCYCCHTGL